MLSNLFRHLKKPTAQELRKEDLEESLRMLHACRKSAESAQAQVRMYEERVARLHKEIAQDAAPALAPMSRLSELRRPVEPYVPRHVGA